MKRLRETGDGPAVRKDDAGPPSRRLLQCGLVAGPLFIGAALVQGAFRADYEPVRHPVSSLAIGEHGWIQVLNFLVTGSLIVAFAIGVRRALRTGRGARWGSILVAA